MAIHVEQLPAAITLAHPDGRQAEFQPNPATETVAIVYTGRRWWRITGTRLELPIADARVYWLELLGKGFEKW
mgnify:CR=1 FL=1